MTGKTRLCKNDRVAELLAAGELNHQQIADEVKLGLRTVERYAADPEVHARVEAARQAIRQAIRAEGIANKQHRIDELNRDFGRLGALIEARARSPLMQGVDGGETGLLVAQPMLVKVYTAADEASEDLAPTKQSRVLHKYAYDDAVVKRRQELAKQAAIEMGQWVEKQEQSGAVVVREYIVEVGSDAGHD
jgi:hypothetical protein